MLKNDINQYNHISPFGYVKEDKVFLKGYLNFKDRAIGVVRESEEKSMEYFVKRFQLVISKVNTLVRLVNEEENKGSFLMKLIHLRIYLTKFNALGDFILLLEQIDVLEEKIRKSIAENRIKNLNIKQAIVAEAESWQASEDWKNTTDKFKELRIKWIKTGNAPEESENQLSERFRQACTLFFDRRKDYFLKLKEMLDKHVEQRENIITELTEINAKENKAEYIDRVKTLQRTWKNIGVTPKIKLYRLGKKFSTLIRIFFSTLAQNSSETDKLTTKKNYCSQAEKLLANGTPYDLYGVRSMQTEWKKIGKLSLPEDRELNVKFRMICNEIFESYFLQREIIDAEPDFDKKSRVDQLNIKINITKKSIEQDRYELEAFEIKYADILTENIKESKNKEIHLKRNNYLNKLKTKERILKKIQDALYFS